MKQKIANYSLILLVFVTFLGLYQAYNQNRIPFVNNETEFSRKTKENNHVVSKKENVNQIYDSKLRFDNARVESNTSGIVSIK